MAEALVEYDYKAKEPDELNIKKGDIITDISFKSGGWWEGTLSRTGKRGMFPDNFVKLITDADGETVHHAQPPRRCKVLFHYKPANEDELELQVGDMIEIISEVEEGWWKGKLKNRIGVFPSNFVAEVMDTKNETREASQRKQKLSRDDSTKQSISMSQEHITSSHSQSQTIVKTTSSVQQLNSSSDSSDLPLLPPKPAKEICRAMYHYEAANADELTLNEGDLITIITKEGQDPGWWKGELKGKVGVFPDNFVQVISAPSDDSKPDRPSKGLGSGKMRDHITKSATTSNMVSGLTGINRKFSEPTKPAAGPPPGAEKTTHTHPSVSKKPVLPPPPMKKPQRSSSDLSKSPTAPSLLSSKLLEGGSPSGGLQISTSISTRGTTSMTSSSVVHHSTIETSNTSSNMSTSGSRWSAIQQNDNSSTISAAINNSGSPLVTNVNTNITTSTTTSSSSTAGNTIVNDKTDGILWSKHRSSYVVSSVVSESNSVVINSGSSEHQVSATTQQQYSTADLDLDLVGRAAMLTHPTANRAKLPKRRPPSAVINKDVSLKDSNFELTLDNDLKNGEDGCAGSVSGVIPADAESSTSPTSLINGDADSHHMDQILTHSRVSVSKTAPWVEELKLSQARKSLQAGRTRVMIGGPSPTTDNITSPPSENSISGSTKFQQQSASSLTTTTTNTTSSSSTLSSTVMTSSATSSMMSSSLIGAVTLRGSTSNAGQQRPQSMVGSLRSSIGSADGLLVTPGSNTAATSTATSSSASPQDTVTVTLRQWTELNDKLARLEVYFEGQISSLTKVVKDLSAKLDEEKQRRQMMQLELEKLTDLVTQV